MMPRRKTLTHEVKRKSGEWYDLLKNVDAYLKPIPFVATPRPTDSPRGGVAFVPRGRVGTWLKTLAPDDYDLALKWLLGPPASLFYIKDGTRLPRFSTAEVEAFRKEMEESTDGNPKRRVVGHYLITPEGRMEWQELLALLENSPHASTFEGVIEHKRGLHQLDSLWGVEWRNRVLSPVQAAFVWLAKLWEEPSE